MRLEIQGVICLGVLRRLSPCAPFLSRVFEVEAWAWAWAGRQVMTQTSCRAARRGVKDRRADTGEATRAGNRM